MEGVDTGRASFSTSRQSCWTRQARSAMSIVRQRSVNIANADALGVSRESRVNHPARLTLGCDNEASRGTCT